MTEAEIQLKITNIETAIDTVLTDGKSYTLSDGHGSQQVTRSSLGELRKMLEYYENKLAALTGGYAAVSTNGGKCGY